MPYSLSYIKLILGRDQDHVNMQVFATPGRTIFFPEFTKLRVRRADTDHGSVAEPVPSNESV